MKKLRYVFFLILILFFSNSVFSSYYADIQIEVSREGLVSVNGKTNLYEFENILNSPLYTSKSGAYWILNLTTVEVLDTFVFELSLPESAIINYIKTTPSFRIDEDSGRIKIIGIGENKPLTLVVQYELTDSMNLNSLGENTFGYKLIIFALLGLILGYFLSRFFHNKMEKKQIKFQIDSLGLSEKKEVSSNFDFSILPQRQQDIIKILQKEEKITQKELEQKMQIPKSSVSRNVKTLEVKGIIVKTPVGQTNYLSLK